MKRVRLVNPTGLGIRVHDKWGGGRFGSPRAGRWHLGLDVQAVSGQNVVSPLTGKVVRRSNPYGDGGDYDVGLFILGRGDYENVKCFLWYARPEPGVIGSDVKAGDILAVARSLQPRYPSITDHVHVGVQLFDQWIDPEPLIFVPRIADCPYHLTV